jgi:hypothetical protein
VVTKGRREPTTRHNKDRKRQKNTENLDLPRRVVHCHDFTTMASLSCSLVQPNSRGWVGYLTHEKPSAEDEQPIKKARVRSPSPPPPTGVTLPNRHGWVDYFAEVEFPPPALLDGLSTDVPTLLAALHEDLTISDDAVNRIIIITRLTCEALIKSLVVSGHTTVTTECMGAAVREVFVGELGELAKVRCNCVLVVIFHDIHSHHILPPSP